MTDVPHIRDHIIINTRIQRYYNGYSGEGPVYLLARKISFEDDFILHVWTRPIIIICDTFDGTGGWIDASGEPFDTPEFNRHGPAQGTNGANGVYPWPDTDAHDRPVGPGGNGGPGLAGENGYHGMPVVLRCRSGFNVRITTQGGTGGAGGAGGNGTQGVNGHLEYNGDPDFPQYETVEGTFGGVGGMGGRGGAGGNAGALVVTSLGEIPDSVLLTGGGPGGPGGRGGQSGPPGQYAPVPPDNTVWVELPDLSGPHGIGTEAVVEVVSAEQFTKIIYADLQNVDGRNFANHWAPFRLKVGDYLYHRYEPNEPDRSGALEEAVRELSAVQELQPDNAEARRLLRQIRGDLETRYVAVTLGQEQSGLLVEQQSPFGPHTQALMPVQFWSGGGANALGYSNNLDIVPRFNKYADEFVKYAGLDMGFFKLSFDQMMESERLQRMETYLNLMVESAANAIEYQNGELRQAEGELELAEKHAEFSRQRISDVKAEIEAAAPQLEGEPFGLGDIVGTFASIGSAAISIAGAIPTCGVSLVGLVPSLVQIQSFVFNKLAPVVQTLMKLDEGNVLENIANTYKKVNKDPESILGKDSTVVDFVNFARSIVSGGSSASPAQVGLVQKGIDTVRETLLADYEVSLAKDRKTEILGRIERAKAAHQHTVELRDSIRESSDRMLKIGMVTLRAAQAALQVMLSFLFLARRSLQIYLPTNKSFGAFLDIGMVSPDAERDFEESYIKPSDFFGDLGNSWTRMLKVADMQKVYNDYFMGTFSSVLLVIDIDDHASLTALRDTRKMAFEVGFDRLPPSHREARILKVDVALVRAAGGSSLVCSLVHGGRYAMRMRDGSIVDQQLASTRTECNAVAHELNEKLLTAIPIDPENGPVTLAFWGRGVVGDWLLEITDPAPASPAVDLGSVTKAQIAIRYMFAYAA